MCNLITKYLESLLAICQKTLQGLVHVKVQRTFWVKYSLTLETFMNDFVTVDLVSFLHSIGAEKLMTVCPLTLVWGWGISDVRLVLHFVRSRTAFEVGWQFLLSTWFWCPKKAFPHSSQTLSALAFGSCDFKWLVRPLGCLKVRGGTQIRHVGIWGSIPSPFSGGDDGSVLIRWVLAELSLDAFSSINSSCRDDISVRVSNTWL